MIKNSCCRNAGKFERNVVILLSSAFFSRPLYLFLFKVIVDEVNIGEVVLGLVYDCKKYQQLFLLLLV